VESNESDELRHRDEELAIIYLASRGERFRVVAAHKRVRRIRLQRLDDDTGFVVRHDTGVLRCHRGP
jgi:hypothetical protein